MTLLAVQVQIVCSCTSVFDGQRIVHHPPLAGTRRISLVLFLQIADFHPPELQVVVFLTTCDELHTAILWHDNLVAVVVVAIVVGIEVADMSLYGLTDGNLVSLSDIVIRFGIVGVLIGREDVCQGVAAMSLFTV